MSAPLCVCVAMSSLFRAGGFAELRSGRPLLASRYLEVVSAIIRMRMGKEMHTHEDDLEGLRVSLVELKGFETISCRCVLVFRVFHVVHEDLSW
jgi:hypothetical protein